MSQAAAISDPTEQIERPTDEEIERVWADHDVFILPGKSRQDLRLHLPAGGGDPRCDRIGQYNSDGTKERDVEVYPVGYNPVCLKCLELWRREQADG